jgi:hypothetical protein
MLMRVSSGLSIMSSLCFVLCLTKGAYARGPEWFEPADPAKPSTSESKVDAPKASPGEGAAGTTKGEATKNEASKSEATKSEATKGEATKSEATKSEAQAQPPAPCPAPAPPPRAAAKPKRAEPSQTEWYGWQTIATDVLAVALLAGSGDSDDGRQVAAGLGVYLLGGPAVHLAHGELGKAGNSLGLRAGLPLAGGVLGYGLGALGCGDSEESLGDALCPVGMTALGVLVGAVGAVAIDAGAIAKKEVRPKLAVSLAPSVVPTKQGTTFGLAGTF